MEESNKDYRLKYIEEKLVSHDERIKGIEQMSKEFTKIATILEVQQEMNKEQNKVLNDISSNLTTLNHTTQALGERVNNLETEVKDVNKRDSISLSLTVRKIIWTVGSLIIGGLATWLIKSLTSGGTPAQ